MSQSQVAPRPQRRRKHLMVPGQPPPHRRDAMSLSRVQRWVMSVAVVSTVLHMDVGLIFAAAYVPTVDAQIGLLVISAAFGVLSVVAGLLIHQQRPLSAWLLLGLVPTLIGASFIL